MQKVYNVLFSYNINNILDKTIKILSHYNAKTFLGE